MGEREIGCAFDTQLETVTTFNLYDTPAGRLQHRHFKIFLLIFTVITKSLQYIYVQQQFAANIGSIFTQNKTKRLNTEKLI